MAEQTTATATQEAPVQTPVPSTSLETKAPPQPVAQPQAVEPPKTEDLVSRVSKVKVDSAKPAETNPFGLTKEDYDKVQSDPTLSKFYKSMQSDYIRKTQEVAEEKKKLSQPSTWTAERLQQEMNKPDFVQAAQQITATHNPPNSGLTDTEYSALTDKEKAQLSGMQQELAQMKLQNWQMQQKQQDEQLKTKYANYAPDIVDVTIKKLTRNEVTATREDIWKVVDYENAVSRAYQLGKEDRQLETKEKTQSMSIEGFAVTQPNEVPQPEKGESNNAYFKRLAQRRLAESRTGK